MGKPNIIRAKFENNEGVKLSANLELPPDNNPKAYCIFAHCFTCGKSLKSVKSISSSLTSRGFAVLNFDFTGLGNSEGEFSESNFSSNIDDLIAANNFLSENYEPAQILIGHSLGGTAVLSAAGKMDQVKAVVTIGAPFDPSHVQNLLVGDVEEIKSKGEAEVNLGGRNFKIKKQFLDDLEKSANRSDIKNLKKALLVMHSPQDKTVDIENAKLIYGEAMHPKSFISLYKADHLLLDDTHAQYAGAVLAAWVMKYIEVSKSYELTTDKHVVVRTGESGYTTNINAGGHYMIADEPESVGGKDLGTSPYGFLMAALGSCTSMTLRMYADRKKWDLKSVLVHLNHEKVHAEDSDKGAKLDRITRTIELEGDLDVEQRKRLLEIADKCPVHKTLNSKILIETNLTEEENNG